VASNLDATHASTGSLNLIPVLFQYFPLNGWRKKVTVLDEDLWPSHQEDDDF
jgi:hypothetical protein